MITSSRRRGFTLVEMAISLGISTIVVAGALSLLIGQQRTFQGGAGDRAAQEGGRVALERLTSELRLAGYGMDPGMAFDFGAAESPQDRAILQPGVGTVAFGGYACQDRVTCRDKTDAPDEIVFLSRDPDFGKLVDTTTKVATEAELHLTGPLNTPLLAGQILQLVCYTGDLYWAYVTVGKTVPKTQNADVIVPLQAATGGDTDFPAQNKFISSDSCFAGELRAFKIKRHRYFIESYDAAGKLVAWGTPDARPYLMLDEGLLDEAGQPIHSVVAQDVEDLQLAYVYPLALPGTQVRGAAPGQQLKDGAAGIDLAPATIPAIPMYSTASKDVARTSGHPANIRAVRIAVVVRQPEADLRISDPELPALFNRAAVKNESHRRRSVFQTTVAIPNMESRGPTFPTYGKAGDPGDKPLNHGGG